MRRLVIAIDCDDVLVRTTPFFVDSYNQKYGTNVPLDLAHVDDETLWGVPHSEMLDRFAQMIDTEEYRALGLSPAQAAVLKQLAEHHELHVVTARKEHERALTQAMLDRDVPGIFTSMEFVGWGGSKGDVCHRIGADVLIDDNASHLYDAIHKGLPHGGALLFGAYPWNEADQSHQDVRHCIDWPDVKMAIDALAEGRVNGSK